ncbi:polysaccharide lyase 6 family protein [Spirochaetia bacterium 38H-sp]|uniref:Polysaccharide lyase 6 family protein n=1 Tax=Rarispira pelagica TaxID=3141764 RepID=A0ABU9UCP8_9SPIR
MLFFKNSKISRWFAYVSLWAMLVTFFSCNNPSLSEVVSDSGDTVEITDGFDDATGSLPSTWTSVGGSWQIVEEGDNKVLQGTDTSTAFLYRNDIIATDFEVEARVKLTASGYVGVIARYMDSKNYAALHFKSDGTLKLFVKYNNSEVASDSYKLANFSKDTYYTIKLIVSGDEYRGSVDGTEYVSLTDSSPIAKYAGLYMYNDTVYFDDVHISASGDGSVPSDSGSSDSSGTSSDDTSGTTTVEPLEIEDTTVIVSSVSELNSAISNMKAGHTILFTGTGIFTDSVYSISDKIASAEHPVIIKCDPIGGATFTKGITIKNSEYITIQGFNFAGDDAYTFIKISQSKNIRILDNSFDHSAATSAKKTIVLAGNLTDSVEIAYNDFKNKDCQGGYITTEYYDESDGTGIATNTWIHHNYFYNIKYAGSDSDREAIAFGDNESRDIETNNIVEYNLFEDCDGENEIITVKTSKVTIRYNTFKNCYGNVSLRFGNNHEVYGNFFYGEGSTSEADGLNYETGGIRIYGSNQKVYNNYMYNLTGTSGYRMPIIIDGGSGDHYKVQDSIIAFNTIVDCVQGIGLGVNYSAPPLNNTIANNIITGFNGQLVTITYGDVSNTWEGNIVYAKAGASAGDIPTANNSTTIEPVFTGTAPFYKLANSFSAYGDYSAILTDDIEGGMRTVPYDVGCDQYGVSGDRTYLTPDDVGVRG